MFTTTYRRINASICALEIDETLINQSVQAAQPADEKTVIQRIVYYYRGLVPFLMYISGLAILPAKWRLALTAFLQALDLLAALNPPDAAPATANAAADTTTTDPTTDPSFKAGKDL